MRERLFKPHVTGAAPSRRVQVACDLARDIYAGGKKSCALDVLSIEGATEEVKKTLQGILKSWIEAFTVVAKEAGLTTSQARLRAEEAVVQIEGALVISRVSNDPAIFERMLKRLPEFLTMV
jgi:TetR/AcrR family transcriptional repressor of lmrAB and yxaGH operons